MTKRDLQEQVRELETENAELQDRLDEVLDIVAPGDEDEEDAEEEDDSPED